MSMHRGRWLLVALALLAAAGLLPGSAQRGAVAAQGPDAVAPEAPLYELTWWTVDAGGAMGGSGGGYTLWGTDGQPDAAIPRGGGIYELRAGFWQDACAAARVPVTITRQGDVVRLKWTHNEANLAYQVHWSTTPYFSPSDATRRAWVAAYPWSYDDVNPPSTAINHYYVVRGTCGAALADGGRQGEFDFALTAGG